MRRGVFINYRGEDSRSYGALLYTELARQFGDEHVFLDSESIPAGVDFTQELLGRLQSAAVLLAVIGSRWLTATDPTGRRRIDNPDDWIHRELAAAFTAGVRVIPILTEQVAIPAAADLPADIAALSRCQYRRLRHDAVTADLARIVTDLTNLDPALTAAARGCGGIPRQLPCAPSRFTGRVHDLAALTDATTNASDTGATVVISAIGGTGGIGKTALALYWAYQHLHWFPDGQLYADLRGFDPSDRPTPAGEAVRGFLVGLGVDPAGLPVDVDAQIARYRSLVAGKRMLIMLDNAHDLDQVTPLLPGSPTCTVLVTSRHPLAGLTLHGARLLHVDVLPKHDAYNLLASRLGVRRLAAEPHAVADLLTICAGLPLAVRIVAARAEQHPDFPLSVLADELQDVSSRLDALDAGDLRGNLRAVLSWSYRALGGPAARLFALLGSAPGPDISLPAAACLAGLPTARVRVVLRELENASLVQQHAPERYRMHDLIRLYAADTALHGLGQEVQAAAQRRVVDYYLHSAHAADRLLDPHRSSILPDPLALGAHRPPLPDVAAALGWLETEHRVLLAAQHTAVRHGWHRTVWQFAWTLDTFHYRRGHRHDRLVVWQAALDAATHLSDPDARICAHQLFGYAHADLEHYDEGIGHLHHALVLAGQHCDTAQQARTHRVLALAWERQADDRQALHHATRAWELYCALDQPVAEADALNAIGWHEARLGECEAGRIHCQAALALHQHHRCLDGEAETLDSLAYIAHRTGQHRQAVHSYQQALTLYRALGNRYQSAHTLDRLGHSHIALGEHEHARVAWQEALQLYEHQGRDTDAARIQRQLDCCQSPQIVD